MEDIVKTEGRAITKKIKTHTTKIMKTLLTSWLVSEAISEDNDIRIRINEAEDTDETEFGDYEAQQLVKSLNIHLGIKAHLLMRARDHDKNIVSEYLSVTPTGVEGLDKFATSMINAIEEVESDDNFVFIIDLDLLGEIRACNNIAKKDKLDKIQEVLECNDDITVIHIDLSKADTSTNPAIKSKYMTGMWKDITRFNFEEMAFIKEFVSRQNMMMAVNLIKKPVQFTSHVKAYYDELREEFERDIHDDYVFSPTFTDETPRLAGKDVLKSISTDKDEDIVKRAIGKPIAKFIKTLEQKEWSEKFARRSEAALSERALLRKKEGEWRAQRLSESQIHFNKACYDPNIVDINDELKKGIVGQEDATIIVSDIIERAISPLHSQFKEKSNIGSAFFAGPSGTGKTQMAYEISKFLFGTDKTVIKFNMAEFKHPADLSTLKGSPTGYTSSENTPLWMQKLNKEPNRVIIFDEIEKAHVEAIDILLGLLVDKEFVAQNDHTTDISKTFIVLTSNIGQKEFSNTDIVQSVHDYFGRIGRTEILGRIGGSNLVPFSRFTDTSRMELFMNKYNLYVKEIKEKTGYKIKLPKADIKMLAECVINGINWKFGARDLQVSLKNILLDSVESSRQLRKYVKLQKDDKVVKLKFKEGRLIVNDIRGMN